MAFRNPNGPPGTGNMNMGLPGQQQQPRPGGSQFMQQQRVTLPGMTPQRYPIMQQGMATQQGVFPAQMYAGQVPPQQGVNMQQQMSFQQQQGFAVQPQQMAPHMQQSLPRHPSHHRQAAVQSKKTEDQVKKDRYFQEQQRKLKQFGKVGSRAPVDSLNINLDEMFGKGGGGGRKEAGAGRPAEGVGAGSQSQSVRTANRPAVEDDGFGAFLQGPTPPVNTPQTPESGPLASMGQQSQLPATEEEFDEFQEGQRNETADSAQTKSVKEEKKVLSLESMMLDSADLTAPSKPTKGFHHKKALRETESTNQAHRQQTFKKSKPWSSSENVTSLFTLPETPDKSGVGLVEPGQGLMAGSSIAAVQGGEGKGVPAWCLNEANLPLVYRQVLEASVKGDGIETNLLYPILMLSGLDKSVLGHIWSMANQTIPGQLTRMELYIALGLIALAQNGRQPTIEALHHFREAPLPILTPKGQSGSQSSEQPLYQQASRTPASGMGAAGKEEDFAPFQEAPGIKPNAPSSQQNRQHTMSKPPFGSPLMLSSDKRKHAEGDMGRQEFSMDSTLKFPKEDRTPGEEDYDEDEFHDFISPPKPAKTPNPSHLPCFPSIAPPKSNSSGALSSIGSNTARQSKFASSGRHSFDSLSQRKEASLSSDDQQKIDLFKMDFEKVFPKVGKKMSTMDDFGSFQSGHGTAAGASSTAKEDDEFGDFAHFKHSASESDLMGMQPTDGDKYEAFRDLAVDVPQIPNIQSAMKEEDFDDFKQAEPAKETSSVLAAVSFKEAAPSMPNFTTNFPTNFPDAHASLQPTPPSSVFEPSQALPTINLSPSLPEEEDGFANFRQAAPVATSSGSQRVDTFSLKADSASTSSSEDKYSVFRVLGSADDREPPDDDFGDFQTNPPAMDTLSVGPFGIKPGDGNVGGDMKKPVSASDLYGMEFDALGSINNGSVGMLNLEDAAEIEPSDDIEVTPTEAPYSTVTNSFQSSQNSKLSKLESIDRLDLKTFDLDLTLGRSVETEGKGRGDSFGEFSGAPLDMTSPVDNADQVVQQGDAISAGAIVVSQGVSTIPLMPSGSSLIGDRYSEVVGNVDDENRHASEWQRCLEICHEAVKKANNIFNNISSSSVCNEVIKSSEGAEYLTAVIEIYRVACRILTSMNALGIDSMELQRLQKDIELVWTNLSAFLAASTLMPAAGSFVFKTAILRPEPTNTDRACGVCLLNVDSRSKAFNYCKDSHKLVYGGRQYHATCANLWVNMVDSILPALPLNRLL